MGRGRGGYTEKQALYRDSGNHKVTDSGSIFVAERYIDLGFESVFRQRHDGEKSLDLTIKTSDDTGFVKNIEVKRVTSNNPSMIAKNIARAGEQISDGDTIAIVLPKHRSDDSGRYFAQQGIEEARRKGFIKGPIEVWFSDNTKVDY